MVLTKCGLPFEMDSSGITARSLSSDMAGRGYEADDANISFGETYRSRNAYQPC